MKIFNNLDSKINGQKNICYTVTRLDSNFKYSHNSGQSPNPDHILQNTI